MGALEGKEKKAWEKTMEGVLWTQKALQRLPYPFLESAREHQLHLTYAFGLLSQNPKEPPQFPRLKSLFSVLFKTSTTNQMYSLPEFGIRCSPAHLWDSWPSLLSQSTAGFHHGLSARRTHTHTHACTHSYFLSFHFFLNDVLLHVWTQGESEFSDRWLLPQESAGMGLWKCFKLLWVHTPLGDSVGAIKFMPHSFNRALKLMATGAEEWCVHFF